MDYRLLPTRNAPIARFLLLDIISSSIYTFLLEVKSGITSIWKGKEWKRRSKSLFVFHRLIRSVRWKERGILWKYTERMVEFLCTGGRVGKKIRSDVLTATVEGRAHICSGEWS